jgi:drug/metabolite transporter (DMT)-like permease
MNKPEQLSLSTVALLLTPPMMWAGNAVVGGLVHDLCPPITLNFLRWMGAFLILLPFIWRHLKTNSGLWLHWKRYAALGFLGVGCYNSLQYLALNTSSPLNVTLVASSTPVFMLAFGALFYGYRVRRLQWLGAAMSIIGVFIVLCHGDWQTLMGLQWVAGDILTLLAAVCWAGYSWLLADTKQPAEIRNDWAAFLGAQMIFGLIWSGMFTAAEWSQPHRLLVLDTPLLLALVFIVLGPALLAYRCWGLGVQRAGPQTAGFFANLTPLFAALFSGALVGDPPQTYHAIAFLLIAGGIVVSSKNQ